MHDMKKQNASKKLRTNRRKKQKKPLNLRYLLRRCLRVGVGVFSVVLVVAGGFFLVQILLASDQFRIDSIRVEGNQRLGERTLVALSDVQEGMSTFSLDLDLIGRKIAENPWVMEARVQRIFPRQVSIRIVEREPVAIINLGYLYYLDTSGAIFKLLDGSDSLDYPVITGFDKAQLELGRHKDRVQLLQVVDLLEDLGSRSKLGLHKISEVHKESGGGLSVYTLEGGVRIRLGSENYKEKLDRLEHIYALLQPKMKMLDYIDLNVDEKVIVRIERSDRAAKS
jgi:cell division protein FtsQ